MDGSSPGPHFPCQSLAALKNMLPTPSTSHVDYDYIYEPAEDSYLLLDTLSSAPETAFLRARFPTATSPPPLVVEIGSGSGVVLAFTNAHAERILGRSDALTLGVDVNQLACQATVATVRYAVAAAAETPISKGDEPVDSGCSNGHITAPKRAEAVGKPAQFLDCLNGDLTTMLRPHSVDILVFNPPYVPTETLPHHTDAAALDEFAPEALFGRNAHLLALSYAGGIDGMETTDRLLDQLPDVLGPRGVAYVLLCRQNRPEAVKERVRSWPGGWRAETVGTSGKKAGWEKLAVLRIWRA